MPAPTSSSTARSTACSAAAEWRTLRPGILVQVTDALHELRLRLHEAVVRLRTGGAEPDATLALIEECAQLASEAAAQVDGYARAAVEPLPDLPGQLPLSAV